MTVCNMSIEAGARAGMVAPDEKTFAYLRGREYAPKAKPFEKAVADWEQLARTKAPTSTRSSNSTPATLAPQVTWGTSPGMGTDIDGSRAGSGLTSRRKTSEKPPKKPWNTWASNRARRCRNPGRPGVHRLLHELPDRRPARSRQGRQRPQSAPHGPGHGGSRLRTGQKAGGKGRAGPNFQRSRI